MVDNRSQGRVALIQHRLELKNGIAHGLGGPTAGGLMSRGDHTNSRAGDTCRASAAVELKKIHRAVITAPATIYS